MRIYAIRSADQVSEPISINFHLHPPFVSCKKYDRVLSVIDVDHSVFQKWKTVTPFYRNVDEEGIVLWKLSEEAVRKLAVTLGATVL